MLSSLFRSAHKTNQDNIYAEGTTTGSTGTVESESSPKRYRVQINKSRDGINVGIPTTQDHNDIYAFSV